MYYHNISVASVQNAAGAAARFYFADAEIGITLSDFRASLWSKLSSTQAHFLQPNFRPLRIIENRFFSIASAIKHVNLSFMLKVLELFQAACLHTATLVGGDNGDHMGITGKGFPTVTMSFKWAKLAY